MGPCWYLPHYLLCVWGFEVQLPGTPPGGLWVPLAEVVLTWAMYLLPHGSWAQHVGALGVSPLSKWAE